MLESRVRCSRADGLRSQNVRDSTASLRTGWGQRIPVQSIRIKLNPTPLPPRWTVRQDGDRPHPPCEFEISRTT